MTIDLVCPTCDTLFEVLKDWYEKSENTKVCCPHCGKAEYKEDFQNLGNYKSDNDYDGC